MNKEEYNQFKEEYNNFIANINEYIKNKSIPLEERWDLYYFAMCDGIYKNIKEWIWHGEVYESLFGKRWYASGYYDRHQTIEFYILIESIEDNFHDYPNEAITQEQYRAVKEEMMESGYTGFVFDW